jgi:predicted RNA-binding protein Jag
LKALQYLLDHVLDKAEDKEKNKEISWEDFKKKVVNK